MTDEKISRPATYWRKRNKSSPIPVDQAIRQGNITRSAYILLGKEAAITFLNTELPDLGDRPLAIATASAAGEARVQTLLQGLAPVPVESDERVILS